MPVIKLGTSELRGFDDTKAEVHCWIEVERPLSYLLKRHRKLPDGSVQEGACWFPKSQCQIRVRPIIKVIDGKPTKIGEQEELFVPDWLWQKAREGGNI